VDFVLERKKGGSAVGVDCRFCPHFWSNSRDMLEGQSCLVSRSLQSSCEQESKWVYMSYNFIEPSNSKRHSGERNEEETRERKLPKISRTRVENLGEGDPVGEDSLEAEGDREGEDSEEVGDGGGENPDNREEQSDEGDRRGENWDTDSLIPALGRDVSIQCLIHCSRSEYGTLASLNWDFHNIIRSGELYRHRRKSGISEHWVYFSCNVLEWEAFDPDRGRWMHLPQMPSNECFMCSDKESLAVGTELLVFGKEVTSHVVLRYSILTNSWSSGMTMNEPRCLFGSASLGEIAIVAGGCVQNTVLSSAELYNSETGTWEVLPSMNKARKLCSGVFMDGKFYVIGGNVSNKESYTCGEEYNLETKTWKIIPNMSPVRSAATEAPPLVAVVNNELYAADYAEKELRKYDKEKNSWFTLGRLPERAVSTNGWGLAFRACGERLIVIGGPRAVGGGFIELNSWVPNNEPPQWNMLASKHSGSFVYNCAVMGC